MKMPTIRLDIVVYYIVMACAFLLLWFCNTQIHMLQSEVASLKEDLKSTIYVPPNEGFGDETKQ